MSQRQKDPLREVSAEERSFLEQLSRSPSQPAVHVTRAKALLAVANGQSSTMAAKIAGESVGDSVASLVSRFKREGLNALEPRHAGGQPTRYGRAETEQILAEVRRVPDPQADGTATWSLALLKQSLRRAGLAQVST